jgi:hypothetical protein
VLPDVKITVQDIDRLGQVVMCLPVNTQKPSTTDHIEATYNHMNEQSAR